MASSAQPCLIPKGTPIRWLSDRCVLASSLECCRCREGVCTSRAQVVARLLAEPPARSFVRSRSGPLCPADCATVGGATPALTSGVRARNSIRSVSAGGPIGSRTWCPQARAAGRQQAAGSRQRRLPLLPTPLLPSRAARPELRIATRALIQDGAKLEQPGVRVSASMPPKSSVNMGN